MTKTSATETTKKRAGVRRSARLAAKAKPPETPKKRVVVRKSVRPEPSGTQKKSSRTKKSTEPIPEDLEIFVEATRIRSRAVPGIEDFQSSGILASGGWLDILEIIHSFFSFCCVIRRVWEHLSSGKDWGN